MSGAPVRDVALGPDSIVVAAGDFRVLATTLPAGYRIPEHVHARHNLAYTLAGGACETFGRERIDSRPGDVLLKPAGLPHSDAFERETRTLQLEWAPDAGSVDGAAFGRVLHLRAGPAGELAARLAVELAGRDAATPMIAEGFALAIVGTLLRRAAPRQGSGIPPWLARVRERIHDEPSARPSIRALADEAGVSADHLARRFHQAFGTTIGAYVRRIRLETAAAELARPGRRISEIALDAGFADQAHFTREFRRAFGRTPGEYRRAIVARRVTGGA